MLKKAVGFAAIASLLLSGTSFAQVNDKNIPQEGSEKTPVKATITVTFDDENGASWAKQYIEYAAKKGYFHGYKGTKHFLPNNPLTREEFATVFVNKFGVGSATTPIAFTDVAQNRWSYNAIEALTTEHYMDYYQSLNQNTFSFHPTQAVSREDVAETLVKAYNLPVMDRQSATTLLQQQFKDAANVAPNLVPYVATAVKYKIMQGDGSKFHPLNSLTRAEAATLLYRLDNNFLVTGTATDTQPSTTASTSGTTTTTVTGTSTDSTSGSTANTGTTNTTGTSNTTNTTTTSTSGTSSN
jgi:S-layer homology domain